VIDSAGTARFCKVVLQQTLVFVYLGKVYFGDDVIIILQ